ncbi:MAG: magnesium transporter, partial [Rhodococcus sp. (in: high G+C Gram-positive bacteria)]
MPETLDDIVTRTSELLAERDVAALSTLMAGLSTTNAVRMLERVDSAQRAVLFRLLPKDEAVVVFERFDATIRSELFESLRSDDVIALFENLDPDDRVELLDELPSNIAHRMMLGLSPAQRALTAPMLGYDRGSVGRRMSPEYVRLRSDTTAAEALDAVRRTGPDAESVYLLPITDDRRTLLGVVTLA